MVDGFMTVGDLAARTGMSAKSIRRFTDLGLIYSRGRSGANYRIYDESAVWCVRAISTLRTLGLTLAEIKTIGAAYVNEPDGDVRSMLEDALHAARRRVDSSMVKLEEAKTRQQEVLTEAGGLIAITGRDPTRS